MAKFKYDLAAQVLIEALFTTDDEACAKYGITSRTLRRYRQRLANDPLLEALFQTKKSKLDDKWADTLPAAMREAVRAIAEICSSMRTDPIARRNPFSLEKLAGALKLCADVYYTGKVIDARLAGRVGRPELEESTGGEKVLAFPRTG
jgi:hypothetical protein